MSFISSIQSFLPLPRPEKRSRAEIERDLEDEIGFHLEMKTRSLMSQHAGVKREDASAVAKKKFGDVEVIKSQCRSIALKERIMLQRVNFIMMVVVMLLVVGVGLQVVITQRYNTLALQAITSDLANMKFETASAAREEPRPVIYLTGDSRRQGSYLLPKSGQFTIAKLLAASGEATGGGPQRAHVRRRVGDAMQEFDCDLSTNEGKDFVLQGDDEVRFVSAKPSPAKSPSGGLPADFAGRWRQVDRDGKPLPEQATLDMMSQGDIRNLRAKPVGVLDLADRGLQFDVIFESGLGTNLAIEAHTHGRTLSHGRWEYRASDGTLQLNIRPAVPELTEPLAFLYVGEGDAAKPDSDARAQAVGDFVVRIFALADRNDANPSQTIRNFLDEEEKTIDERYGDDPATAGMIRELIAARRKILDVDARVSVGEGLRVGVGAASSDPDARLKAVNEFLQDVLASADSHPKTLHMKNVLDKAEAEIATNFADNPEVAARLRETINKAREQMKNNDDEQDKQRERVAARDDDDEFPKLSPFQAVLWNEYTPFVNINDTWGELLAINGVPVADIVNFCREHYPGKDRKRFSEDLVQVLTEMGHRPGMNVKLQFKEFRTGSVMAIEQAPMTKDNRGKVYDINTAAADNDPDYPAWTGEPPAPVDGAQSSARPPPVANASPVPRALTAEQVQQDVDVLAAAMRSQFSYLHLRDIKLDPLLKQVKDQFPNGAKTDELAFALQKMICRFGDGHAGVSGFKQLAPRVFAPFIIGDAGGRCVAVKPDSSAFLDPDHPYLVSINGVPIERLIELAGVYVADGSPALKRRRSIDIVHCQGLLAEPAGVKFDGPISVELASEDGSSKRTMSAGAALAQSRYSSPPEESSRLLEGNIGYLRLERMDRDSTRNAMWMMPEFRNTIGLIIDVRDNGGGSRDALIGLLPYFLPPDSPPQVLNVAAYRLSEAFEEDHLAARFMYRRDDAQWSDAERRAIHEVAAKFKPQWSPPAGEFSDWHYLVISRPSGADIDPALYHYDKPVIVLLDGGCFSATDIFLGAFKGRANVTLLGTPSSGGSGRKQSERLPASGLQVSLSSMVSYLPTGTMYDLTGIEPDVVLQPIATDFIGATDSQLTAAVARLRAK